MTDPLPPYPVSGPQGTPEPVHRHPVLRVVLVAGAAIALGCGLLVGGAYALLYVVNPLGDEWVCAEGEAPVIATSDRATTAGCVREGTTLPEDVVWDPFGNRPMPDNCDQDGWVLVERPVVRRGVPDVEQDCAREDLVLPDGWTPAEAEDD
ncbi:hypothetical protein [Nocardioides dongkuii]|uniref:hypothetical protein n=1 Tax=Nocardioides dongkuii TaxID=2760089 RepID=UPI0018788B4D|nr:hypothetical protein [Nocardioides dongkuii]